MSKDGKKARLYLVGAPRVEVGGQVVSLRRKGLTVLAVLALEGPSRREWLADLLWDTDDPMNNLRVEIHRVRRAFRDLGLEPFGASLDPLALSAAVEIDSEPPSESRELLPGLEDLAPRFERWLDMKRATSSPSAGDPWRSALVGNLAPVVSPPFVLVLAGRPGSEPQRVARQLARRIDLPFQESTGVKPEASSVRFVRAATADQASLAEFVIADTRNVWVISTSSFGEDPAFLLHLRSQYPADRLRFVELKPLSWTEARKALPATVGFREGTHMYMASNGNPQYLRELIAMRGSGQYAHPVPIPQRTRAAYGVEFRRLSEGARRTLERLSIAPLRLTHDVVDRLDGIRDLDELERTGWLAYDGREWTITDSLARRIMFEEIPPGHRTRLAERLLGGIRRPHHRRIDRNPSARPKHAGVGARPVAAPRTTCEPGAELVLALPSTRSPMLAWNAGRLVVSRPDRLNGHFRTSWPLPSAPILLRLGIRDYAVGSHGGVPGSGPRELFRLELRDRPVRSISFRDVEDDVTSLAAPNKIVVPLREASDNWFLLDDASVLELASGSQAGVCELDLRAYEVASRGYEVSGARAVVAVDLGRVDGRPSPDGSVVAPSEPAITS